MRRCGTHVNIESGAAKGEATACTKNADYLLFATCMPSARRNRRSKSIAQSE
jgi:hypothetical protein